VYQIDEGINVSLGAVTATELAVEMSASQSKKPRISGAFSS